MQRSGVFWRSVFTAAVVLWTAAVLLGACQSSALPASVATPLSAPSQAVVAPAVTDSASLPAVDATAQDAIAVTPLAETQMIALLMADQGSGPGVGFVASVFQDRLRELDPSVAQDLILADAGGNVELQQQQAEKALEQGAKVLVLNPVDEHAASMIAEMAKANGVPLIAYDRLVKESDGVTLFISSDESQLGQMQAQMLLKGLGRVLRPEPAVILLFSQTQSEVEKQAVRKALDGKTTILAEEQLPGNDRDAANQIVTELLEDHAGKVDGVYAATDALAGGAIEALQEAFFVFWPTVTGDGAEKSAVQRVLAGTQYATFYCPVRWQAEAAADLAYGILKKKQIPGGMVNASVNNGKAEIPAVLLPLMAVTKANVRDTVVLDGYWTAQELCTTDYQAACRETGLIK